MDKVLILGCNFDQIPYIKELKKFFCVGLDKNIDAPGKNLCDKFYNIGYDELDRIIEIGYLEKLPKVIKYYCSCSICSFRIAQFVMNSN